MNALDDIQARRAGDKCEAHTECLRSDASRMLSALQAVTSHIDDCEGTSYRVDGQYIKWIIDKTLRGEA